MSSTTNSLDTDQNMASPSNGDTSALFQLLAQLVQGQQDFGQAVTQILNQPAPVPQTQSAPPPKASVAEPDVYDGKYDTFDPFMSQLYLLFSAKSAVYANDQMKIVTALSFMKKGFAGTWATNVTKELREGTITFANWTAFERKLKEVFDDPNKRRAAQVKLHVLKKNVKQSADEYFAEFDQLATLAGFNDEALLDVLQQNLDRLTFDAIVAAPQVDRTLTAWRDYAKRYDRNKRANERNEGEIPSGRKFGEGRSGPGWIRPSNMVGGRVYPNQGTGMTGTNTNTGGQTGITDSNTGSARTFPGQGQPMDLDRARGRAGPIKCYNCGEMGHISRNCPKPKGWQTARAMFESLADEQKKEVAEIFGIGNNQVGDEDFQGSRE
jgi:hypothetical protein